MKSDNNQITQKRYSSFLHTPLLWNGELEGLKQFEYAFRNSRFNAILNSNLRLGKYVEGFLTFTLHADKNFSKIAENIQIQENKKTLGEFDFLFEYNDMPIHLELSYKFYIVDFSRGDNEISYCIGPNNRDSLKEKINKLKHHQLPLLTHPFAKPYLDKIAFQHEKTQQYVLVKSQLFLPYDALDFKFKVLNNKCIEGFYISGMDIVKFNNDKFYIPRKKDWLLKPYSDVNWINYDSFQEQLQFFKAKNSAPLCWLKTQKGILKKFFVIWWK